MNYKNVIIWGYTSPSHTHYHIHHGYSRGFSSLGFNVYWTNDNNKLPDINFSESLFLTTGTDNSKIPIRHDCTYILHHVDNTRFKNTRVINLCNYLKFCEDGVSHNYPGSSVEKISDLLFYDKDNKAIYQPWATDLLPNEINENDVCLFDENKQDINYVGEIWSDNITEITQFKESCEKHDKRFNNFTKISDEEHKKLIRESYIAPDVRGPWHKTCGYIPCRIFKNISYGQITGTNSEHVYKVFGDMVAYDPDANELFNTCVEKNKNVTKEQITSSMLFIKNNHTYINRINNILFMLKEMYAD